MTYDFEGKWSSKVGFNSALHAPDDSTQLTNVDKVLETLRVDHGMDE